MFVAHSFIVMFILPSGVFTSEREVMRKPAQPANMDETLLRARKEFDALRAEHRSAMAAAARAHEKAINTLRAEHRSAMKAVSRAHEKAINTLRAKHRSAMKAASREAKALAQK